MGKYEGKRVSTEPRETKRVRGGARSARKRRKLKIFLAILLALLLIAGLTSIYLMRRFEGNIETETFIPESVTGVERPIALPEVEGALNILVMGSDTRAGANGVGIGGATPGLSDTTLLIHLAEDRSFAYGVSLPRDSMVQRPACPRKSGEGIDEGGLTQFNAAFAVGGPACTVATVEQETGVRIDHFAVIDFDGFRRMVDAVGGVTMCVPEEVNDPIGKIQLPKGTYEMNGEQALGYVRLRHGIGVELGDIGRMKRQQAFMAALVEKVTSSGTLANPVRLIKLLEGATESLTTDPDLANLRRLAGLASSFSSIGMKKIQFVTVPFDLWEPDPNRVVWADEADEIWDAIREDRPLPKFSRQASLSPRVAEQQEGKKKPKSSTSKLSSNDREVYGLC